MPAGLGRRARESVRARPGGASVQVGRGPSRKASANDQNHDTRGAAASAAIPAAPPAKVSAWLTAIELTFILAQLLHWQVQIIGSP